MSDLKKLALNAVTGNEHQAKPVKKFIALLTCKTELLKRLFLIQNSPIMGSE